MHRLRLSTVLIVVNAGLLLLAVAGVAYAAAGLLQRFADEQALARVAQASLTARQEIGRAGDDALTSARLLSEIATSPSRKYLYAWMKMHGGRRMSANAVTSLRSKAHSVSLPSSITVVNRGMP